MMYRIFSALVAVLFSVSAAFAGEAAVIGGAIAGGKLAKSCVKHPILCGAVAVGGAIAGTELNERVKRRAQEYVTPEETGCRGGYVGVYRVVGRIEHAGIITTQRYMLMPGGMEQKQFWFDLADADWYENEQRVSWRVKGPLYFISSQVCRETIAMGHQFKDVGHSAVSFEAEALRIVNRDALATGGIKSLFKTER